MYVTEFVSRLISFHIRVWRLPERPEHAPPVLDHTQTWTPGRSGVPAAVAGSTSPLGVTRHAATDRHTSDTMGFGHTKLLVIMTSICACASFAFLCIAVATDYWLYTEERMLGENQTFFYKKTFTGLWRTCVENVRQTPKIQCEYVNYFSDIDRDGLGAMDSILLSMRRSTFFPVISLLILLVGEIYCFLGHCNHRKKINTFVSGILFVVGGLVILVGIILFIGAITEEDSNKSRSGMDKPRFSYYYGASFILTISSFIISELTGVLSVYLYISRYKRAYRKKQERMAMIDAIERPNATIVPPVSTPLNRRPSLRSSLHQSCEHSRENSPCRSEAYYTYMPVSYSMKDTSNYTLPREVSRYTVSTMADTHATMPAAAVSLSKDSSVHSVRELDTFRRTTPV